jgi:colicin import membrane protein
MKTNQKVSTDFAFKRALTRSLLLHVALIIIVIARIAFPSAQSSRPMSASVVVNQDNPTPIQAAMVDGEALDAEVARQEKAKTDALAAVAAEKKRIVEEQKRLAAEKVKLEQARKAEEKRLAEIQAQKKAAEKAQIAEKKRATELAQKTAAEKALKAKMAAAEAAKAKKQADLAKALEGERMPVVADAGALSGDSLRELDRYKMLVQQQIMRNWFVQGAPAAGSSTLLFVRVAPNGTVLDVKIKRSSGNDALDRSAMAAVFKASPLPVPQEAALSAHFRELNLTLRPDDVVSGG